MGKRIADRGFSGELRLAVANDIGMNAGTPLQPPFNLRVQKHVGNRVVQDKQYVPIAPRSNGTVSAASKQPHLDRLVEKPDATHQFRQFSGRTDTKRWR